MVEQILSNNNESATEIFSKIFWDLHEAIASVLPAAGVHIFGGRRLTRHVKRLVVLSVHGEWTMQLGNSPSSNPHESRAVPVTIGAG
jgi:hypothetical protein